MVEDNRSIEDIRKDAIEEIKEKARKNPKILSPFNKERLEYQKKLKFANGNGFTCWMQQNGIMENPTDIDRKHMNTCAQKAGFKDFNDRKREWTYETGRNLPREFNEDCSSWFGDFTENLMIQTFEDAIKMPPNNPGFDWTCKRGDKIDNKGRCLSYSNKSNWSGWKYLIKHNNVADWFILSAWDNRDSLTPLHVWVFHKDDIVGGRRFCDRDSFSITNTPKKLKEFGKYEVTNRLDKLKELCNKHKEKE